MSEADTIAQTKALITVDTLTTDLRALGLGSGDTVLVHSSLSSIGWVNGGAAAVLYALLAVLGKNGTLVMPTHSADISDPAEWSSPPVPAEWHDEIRATMPPYNPLRTPTRDMGRIPELFRTWPGVKRSAHPTQSMAAHGPLARHILEPHTYDDPFGEASPLRRLYDLDAKILMIGVGYHTCTMLHLAERRAWPNAPVTLAGAPVLVNNRREWLTYPMPRVDSDIFPEMREVLDNLPSTRLGTIGQAESRVLAAGGSVDRATQWFRTSARAKAEGT